MRRRNRLMIAWAVTLCAALGIQYTLNGWR